MKYIIGIALLLVAASSFAASGPLPELSLADQSGAAVNQLALKRSSNWALLVVDANKTQTQSTLMRLQRKEGDWFGSLAVVAIGNQAAFNSLVARNEKLVGVRWYRDTSGSLLKTLGLPGVPAMLGMTPDNLVSWRSIGLPEQVDKAQSLVGSWVSSPILVK